MLSLRGSHLLLSRRLARVDLVLNGNGNQTTMLAERSLENTTMASNETTTMLIALLVGVIGLVGLVCIVQWGLPKCFGGGTSSRQSDDDACHGGMNFSLTGDQRRAVLEVIFSESSKPATELDVSTRPKQGRDSSFEQHSAPANVEIPEVGTVDTIESLENDIPCRSEVLIDDRCLEMNGGSKTLTASLVVTVPTPLRNIKTVKVKALVDETTNVFSSSPCNIEKGSLQRFSSSPEKQASMVEVIVSPVSNRSSRACAGANSTYFHQSEGEFHIHEHEKREETKQMESMNNVSVGDIESQASTGSLDAPPPPTPYVSLATAPSGYTLDDDESMDDNVCPICLSGYQVGELLVSSKHCTHTFHKECIFAWLEKHEDCPVCRNKMLSDSEVSRAATNLIGKTRMYAVASRHTTSISAPERPPRAPSMHVTVRRASQMR